MTITTLSISLLLLITLYFISRLLLTPLLSPLRSIPGPFLARFTRLWFLQHTWHGRIDLDLVALHATHGPIIRYGPNHYSFNDPEALKSIYGHGSEFDKADWYMAWNAPGFKTLFTEPSVKAHARLRRKFAAMYTMSSMVHYEPFADRCIALLCEKLEGIANANGETDLGRWLLSYAGDAVSMITYSRRMGFLDAGEDVGGFFATLVANTAYNTFVGIFSEWHAWLFHTTALLKKLGLARGSPRMFISTFNAELIEEKEVQRKTERGPHVMANDDDDATPKDFLSKFLDQHDRDPEAFTSQDINIGLVSNVVAGSDTTAAALTSIFYHLLKNPTSLSKLREEIDAARQSGVLSSPPTFKEAHDMPYLQAVIQEALRMVSPVGLPLQRVVPAGGCVIGGYFFPAGTVVGTTILALHLNPAVFGSDAHVFRPERWLEADKETLGAMQRAWIPFGMGTRTCIGKNISLLEICKVVPELVAKFDFALTTEAGEGEMEMEWVNRWFLRPVEFPVQVKLRSIQT